jgi:hypothetical protein
MTSKGGEAMLPIHCAAEGGSLEILHWLVDVHFCPLKRIRTSNRNKSQHTDELITTSKGKSVLEIAMSKQNVDILRYLVNDKDIDVKGIRDLNIALAALQTVLRTPYNDHNDDSQSQITPVHRALSETPETKRPTRINNGLPSFTISGIDDSDSASDISAKDIIVAPNDSDDDQSVATTVHDAVSLDTDYFLIARILICSQIFIFVSFPLHSASFVMKTRLIALSPLVGIKYAACNAVRTWKRAQCAI